MTPDDFAQVALYVVGSMGGSGLIILGLSNWLGKVWAQRIMDTDRAKHERDLEKLRAEILIKNEQHLKGFHDKLVIYREAVNLISDILGDFDFAYERKIPLDANKMDIFNRRRMQVYGFLAMMTSQEIMDAQDRLMDHLLMVTHGNEPYVWAKVRELAIALLNEMRKDIGIDVTPIKYNGVL